MIDLCGYKKENLINRPKAITPLIVQIGVGGTGSNLSQQLSQMLASLGRGYYVLADPDTIEEKNLKNQLFSKVNIGQPKAEILAKRYSAAYQIPIHSYTNGYIETTQELLNLFNTNNFVKESDTAVLPILIGCVDNNFSRKVMHEFFIMENISNIVYIDAGNESAVVPIDYPTRDKENWSDEEIKSYNESGWTGQVVIGTKLHGDILTSPVAERYPDILNDSDDLAPSQISCEELSSSDPQRLITNRLSAMIVATYLAEIFECATISNCMTVFHAKRGYMKSEAI